MMIYMGTPHNNANKGDIAKVVIMPGDPYRADTIAKMIFTTYQIVSDVRGIRVYTGLTQNNKRLSVMASGMGQPSIGIYCYELFKEYDVDLIIRVGTAGTSNPNIHVKDVLLGEKAYTMSNFAYLFDRQDIYEIEASKNATLIANQVLKAKSFSYNIGTIFTSDAFYGEGPDIQKIWDEKNIIGVEMESFALYYTAKRLNKNALTLLTVSNHFKNKEEELSIKEKETSMNNMIKAAEEIAEKFIS